MMNQESKKDQVWKKAKEIRGKSPEVWRRDPYGNKIRKASYGTVGKYGWEMDHKTPKSKSGSDNISNLQALHWEKNRQLGDKTKKPPKR